MPTGSCCLLRASSAGWDAPAELWDAPRPRLQPAATAAAHSAPRRLLTASLPPLSCPCLCPLQVSQRNDSGFFLTLFAAFVLPAFVILAVAYGTGYLDTLAMGRASFY